MAEETRPGEQPPTSVDVVNDGHLKKIRTLEEQNAGLEKRFQEQGAELKALQEIVKKLGQTPSMNTTPTHPNAPRKTLLDELNEFWGL